MLCAAQGLLVYCMSFTTSHPLVVLSYYYVTLSLTTRKQMSMCIPPPPNDFVICIKTVGCYVVGVSVLGT